MDYNVLNTELTTDPLTRGYAGMTDQQAADDINTVYRLVNYPVFTDGLNAAIRESLKWTSYREKSETQTIENVYDFPAMREFMDLFFSTSENQALDLQNSYFTWLIDSMVSEGSMGAGAADALRTFGEQTVSRGTELGLGTVAEGDVQQARAL